MDKLAAAEVLYLEESSRMRLLNDSTQGVLQFVRELARGKYAVTVRDVWCAAGGAVPCDIATFRAVQGLGSIRLVSGAIANRSAAKQRKAGKPWVDDDSDPALLCTLIGARIRDERVRRGWSQTQLADAIGRGVSQRTVSRWETGEIAIGLSRLIAIAHVFGQQPGKWLDQALAGQVTGEELTREELQSFLDAIPDAKARHGPLTAGSDALMDNLESYLTRVLAGEAVDPDEARECLTDIIKRGQWWLAEEGIDPYAESRAAWVDLFTRLSFQLDVRP